MIKICSRCGRSLPVEMFAKRRDRSKVDGHWINGYYAQCRDCISKTKAKWREAHPGYFKEYHKKHRVLKPKTIKICPNCGKEFETNHPKKIYCRRDCLPQTPIRQLKSFLKVHYKIDRAEFFKARYKRRNRQYYQNWKKKHQNSEG
jgi:ribosomal protein S27AE